SSASRRITSSLAFPSTGGAVTFIFKQPSISPAIALFDDRGNTRIVKVIPLSSSAASIITRLTANEYIQNDRLQESQQYQQKHHRNIEHSDRRYQFLNWQNDRIGYPHHKCEKRVSGKDEPLRQKADKDEQDQNTQKSV